MFKILGREGKVCIAADIEVEGQILLFWSDFGATRGLFLARILGAPLPTALNFSKGEEHVVRMNSPFCGHGAERSAEYKRIVVLNP